MEGRVNQRAEKAKDFNHREHGGTQRGLTTKSTKSYRQECLCHKDPKRLHSRRLRSPEATVTISTKTAFSALNQGLLMIFNSYQAGRQQDLAAKPKWALRYL
jgi:hypothetical protein